MNNDKKDILICNAVSNLKTLIENELKTRSQTCESEESDEVEGHP
jgi:hypothetical protein